MAEKQTIIFEGVDNVSKVATNIKGGIDGLSKAANILGGIFITGAMAKGFQYMISEGAESERVFANLEATLKNITGTTSETAGTVNELSQRLMQMSGFTDEQLNASFTRLLQITQDVGVSTQAMSIAMDFARGTGQDLITASESLGRALEGNVRGLKQYGINIREGATGTEVLMEVQKRFAGASETFAQTATGSWERLKTSLSNIAEGIGGKFLPKITEVINTFNDFLGLFETTTNPRAKQALDYVNQLKTTFNGLSEAEKKSQAGQELLENINKAAGDYTAILNEQDKAVVALANDNGKLNQAISQTTDKIKEQKIELTDSQKEWKRLQEMAEASTNFVPTAIELFKGLGTAIGATAAGSTTAWKEFAKNSLISVLNFAEQAIEAQGLLALASQNYAGVALAAAGLIGIEALKSGVSASMSTDTATTSSDLGGTSATVSTASTASTGAASVSAPSSTNLTIQLFNPTFMDKESKLQTVNDLLNLAVANGWNITRTAGVSMA